MTEKNIVNPPNLSITPNHSIVPGLAIDDWVFVSGLVGMRKSDDDPPRDFATQSDHVFRNMAEILNSMGSSLRDIYQMTVWLSDMRFTDEFLSIRTEYLNSPMATTIVGSHGLRNPDALLEVEVRALRSESSLQKEVIDGLVDGSLTDPLTVPGVKVDDLIVLSGQHGRHAGAPDQDYFRSQMATVFEDVQSVLQSGNSDLSDILHMTTWMTDLRNTDHFTNVRSQYLDREVTTSTRIGVPGLRSPESKVEMEILGIDSSVGKQLVDHSEKLPLSTTERDGETYPRYWQCVRAEDWVFTAGMVGVDDDFVPVSEDFTPQARKTLENVEIAIESAGLSRDELLHTRTYLTDMRYFDDYVSIFDGYFNGTQSTASIVQSPVLAQEPLKIEVEAIAYGS